jgi:hypothetical protein
MSNPNSPNLEGVNSHKRNCTVLALAHVANIAYLEAFEIAKQAGRQDNKGFKSEKLIAFANKKFGKGHFKKIKRTTITVQKFCKKYSQGRYYVRKKGHAYAIIDGVVYDRTSPKPLERILEAWKFTGNFSKYNKQSL